MRKSQRITTQTRKGKQTTTSQERDRGVRAPEPGQTVDHTGVGQKHDGGKPKAAMMPAHVYRRRAAAYEHGDLIADALAAHQRHDMVGLVAALDAIADAIPDEKGLAVQEYGAWKYSRNGWMQVPDGVNRYLDALARHGLERARGHVYDGERGARTRETSGLEIDGHVWCSATYARALVRP